MLYYMLTALVCLLGRALASPIPTEAADELSDVMLSLAARSDASAGTHLDTMAIVGILAGASVLFVLIGALICFGRQGKW